MKAIILFLFNFTFIFCSPTNPIPRIIGGVETEITDAPYIISLQLAIIGHICGASIIGNHVALSAAHCTYELPVESLSARIGSSYIKKGGVVVQVDKVKRHEMYNEHTHDNDLSLVFFKEDLLAISSITRSINLIKTEPLPGDKLTVYGWGTKSYIGLRSNQLNKVTIDSISRRDCQEEYLTSNIITENMICAYTKDKDSCKFDSGGPLVDANGNLVGVVSFGTKCAVYPGVYVNVASELEWIQNNMKYIAS